MGFILSEKNDNLQILNAFVLKIYQKRYHVIS